VSSVSEEISDNTSRAGRDTVSVTVGDSAHVGKAGERLESTQSSEQANADTVAGQTESERIRPPEDSTETRGVITTDSAGSVADNDTIITTTTSTEMAQEQSDLSGRAPADSAALQVQVDTTSGQTEMAQQAPADTSAIQAQLDTTAAAVAQQAPEATASVQAQVDTTASQQPAEVAAQPSADTVMVATDSGDQSGNVQQKTEANAQRADAAADAAAVGAAGVQSTRQMATGADAVALISREGRRCAVIDGEDIDKRWDMASSPATMNPCGTGTMTLPAVQTGEQK
jgi:hypothetical protein